MQGASGFATIAIEEKKGTRVLLNLMPLPGDQPGGISFFISGDSKTPSFEEIQKPTKMLGNLAIMSSGEALFLMIDGDILYPKKQKRTTGEC